MRKKDKLIPIICEICGETEKSALHKHHIIPRTDPLSTNDDNNLAILCASCHNKLHAGLINIIGIFPSTKLPYKRVLVYEKGGIRNIPWIDGNYIEPKPKVMKVY